LDTHIAVWLCAGLIAKITENSKQAIDACDVLISPMVMLENFLAFQLPGPQLEPIAISSITLGTFNSSV
jgi:hypothetical protein